MSTFRIGCQMRAAVEFVVDNPGCCRYDVAYQIAGSGNIRGGIAAVNRAIKAGLIRVEISTTGEVPKLYCPGASNASRALARIS